MNRFRTFFAGRYGSDALNKAMSVAACVLLILSMFVHGPAGTVCMALATVLLVGCYVRMLSRDYTRRRAENDRYLQLVAPLTRKLSRLQTRVRQLNTYSFFKCPNCATVLRVPKNKGHVRITCKNCGNVFDKNT